MIRRANAVFILIDDVGWEYLPGAQALLNDDIVRIR